LATEGGEHQPVPGRTPGEEGIASVIAPSTTSTTIARESVLTARQKFLDSFPSDVAKSEHFRAIARASGERRLVLTGDYDDALVAAYRLLAAIAGRPTGTETGTLKPMRSRSFHEPRTGTPGAGWHLYCTTLASGCRPIARGWNLPRSGV
jgi:hypothetical protein